MGRVELLQKSGNRIEPEKVIRSGSIIRTVG